MITLAAVFTTLVGGGLIWNCWKERGTVRGIKDGLQWFLSLTIGVGILVLIAYLAIRDFSGGPSLFR